MVGWDTNPDTHGSRWHGQIGGADIPVGMTKWVSIEAVGVNKLAEQISVNSVRPSVRKRTKVARELRDPTPVLGH